MKNISDKVAEKIETHFSYSIIPCQKVVPIVGKNIAELGRL
jgi:hypothetical protein